MAGFRELMIHGIGSLASRIPTEQLRKLTGQNTILPVYHTISNEELPHIKNLYQIKNVECFKQDLDFLLKYFEPIDLSTFLEQKGKLNKRVRPSFLLTFDDGLREFHDVIAPILIEKGVPAICFLNTAFLDNRDLFFRFKASLLIDRYQKSTEIRSILGGSFNSLTDLSNNLLTIGYDDRAELDIIAERIGLSFNDHLKEQQPYLTSKQVRSLVKKGFHFGAHSIDHPEYGKISTEEQLKQTANSVTETVEAFDLRHRVFAFPFTDHGVELEFFQRLEKQCPTDATFGCAGLKKDIVATNFQRIPMEMGGLSAKTIINSEMIYYLLKNPFGRNLIKRK